MTGFLDEKTDVGRNIQNKEKEFKECVVNGKR